MQKIKLPFGNYLEQYLCDKDFESDILRLLFAMQIALKKNKLKKFNNEDAFNFILAVLFELESSNANVPELNLKYRPNLQ